MQVHQCRGMQYSVVMATSFCTLLALSLSLIVDNLNSGSLTSDSSVALLSLAYRIAESILSLLRLTSTLSSSLLLAALFSRSLVLYGFLLHSWHGLKPPVSLLYMSSPLYICVAWLKRLAHVRIYSYYIPEA